jgi:hypothetical protein
MSAFRHNVLINGSFEHTFSTAKVNDSRKIKQVKKRTVKIMGKGYFNVFLFFGGGATALSGPGPPNSRGF